MTLSNTIIVVVGPTASGKSKLATKIAGLYNGEIINADSRQIYRYLNIGTAKPSTSELQEIPHHLVDIINPDEKYSLGLFLKDANKSITKIFSVGKLPVVVGGSGQYIWALLEGWQVPEIPPSSQIRIQLENKVSQYGYQSIHKELADIDSAAASRIDARNTRRVIRALELNYLNLPTASLKTGKISPEFQYIIVGLNLDRQILYNKIDIRVDSMIESGWISEVQNLLEMGYELDLPSMSSIGYKEIGKYVINKTSLSETISVIKNRSHRFARQQHNWFRKTDPRIKWFDASKPWIAESFIANLVG